MRLADYLDKGATLGGEAPCLTMNGATLTYAEVQDESRRIAAALRAAGIGRGDRVAILADNDPLVLTCVFGISRLGAVWCPIDPGDEAADNRELLDLFGCRCLLFQEQFAPIVGRIREALPALTTLACLDSVVGFADSFAEWVAGAPELPFEDAPADGTELCVLAGTSGTTGTPKGVRLTGNNLATATAATLTSYPFGDRPRYLALAPLTHSAGILTFPILSLGGEIVLMPTPDLGAFLRLIERYRITHAFLPPGALYALLDHPGLDSTSLDSLRCLWYGAAPMSPTRLKEALHRIGPVLGQLYGQAEAPNIITALAPADHFRPDGSIATERLTAAGRPTPPTRVAIMNATGDLLPSGAYGEVVVRGPLVMAGYHHDPTATTAVRGHGWHHTGDLGYLDEDNLLHLVGRAEDTITTGHGTVYPTQVEHALTAHPAVQDSAVVGLPGDERGERVTAVVQLRLTHEATSEELTDFVARQLGSVKTPEHLEIWPELPYSPTGKVRRSEIRHILTGAYDDLSPLP